MDEDLRELAMILARNSAPKESSLTVRWVAVIGIFTIICGYLFVGHNTNASQISKLDARIEAEILNLYSNKEGHAVCVTKDRETMVTNERVVHLFPETWEQDIMRYFRDKYEVII